MKVKLTNTLHNTSMTTLVEDYLVAEANYLSGLAWYAQCPGSYERKKLNRINRKLCPHDKDCCCGGMIQQEIV